MKKTFLIVSLVLGCYFQFLHSMLTSLRRTSQLGYTIPTIKTKVNIIKPSIPMQKRSLWSHHDLERLTKNLPSQFSDRFSRHMAPLW